MRCVLPDLHRDIIGHSDSDWNSSFPRPEVHSPPSHIEFYRKLSGCSGLKELEFCDTCSLAPPSANDVQGPIAITTLVIMQPFFTKYNGAFASLTSPIGQNMARAAGSLIVFDRLQNIFLGVRTQAEFSHTCRLLLEESNMP